MSLQPDQTQPEQTSQPEASGSSGDLSDSHFDTVEVEGEQTPPEELPGGLTNGLEMIDGKAVMSKAMFCEMMGSTFKMSGGILGLETLTDAPERQGATDAFETIWDIAAESQSMRWLIEPQQIWMQRTITIGAFALPLARACGQEVKQKRIERRAARMGPVQPEQKPEHSDAAYAA